MYKIKSVPACPEKLFQELAEAPVAKYIRALKEINIAFIANEEQVKLIIEGCFMDVVLTNAVCGVGGPNFQLHFMTIVKNAVCCGFSKLCLW